MEITKVYVMDFGWTLYMWYMEFVYECCIDFRLCAIYNFRQSLTCKLSKFLKDGTDILAIPISQLCNLCIKLNPFLEVVKLQKSNCFLKKAPKLTLKSTAPFHSSPFYQKLLKWLLMTKDKSFWVKTKFATDFNLVSEKTIPLTLVSDI